MARAYPVASNTFREADEILGVPLFRLMTEGPEEELTATKNAQPAILAHSVAVLRVIKDRLGPVSVAAGHSLGEFSAHVAAGTISFPDALEAVRLRGELMFRAGQLRRGTMAAVLGLEDSTLRGVCEAVDAGVCVPANFNSSGQTVISGDVAGVEQAMTLAKRAGARRTVPLSVSGAFHSPLMEPAVQGLRDKLDSVDFRDPDFPVITNVTAEPVTSGARARELLVEQLTSPVLWAASVARMAEDGVEQFVEVGPGAVLCGLVRRSAARASCVSVGEPDDIDKLTADG